MDYARIDENGGVERRGWGLNWAFIEKAINQVGYPLDSSSGQKTRHGVSVPYSCRAASATKDKAEFSAQRAAHAVQLRMYKS